MRCTSLNSSSGALQKEWRVKINEELYKCKKSIKKNFSSAWLNFHVRVFYEVRSGVNDNDITLIY